MVASHIFFWVNSTSTDIATPLATIITTFNPRITMVCGTQGTFTIPHQLALGAHIDAVERFMDNITNYTTFLFPYLSTGEAQVVLSRLVKISTVATSSKAFGDEVVDTATPNYQNVAAICITNIAILDNSVPTDALI